MDIFFNIMSYGSGVFGILMVVLIVWAVKSSDPYSGLVPTLIGAYGGAVVGVLWAIYGLLRLFGV